MNKKNRQRRTSLVLVFVLGATIVLLIFFIALGAGGNDNNQNNDRINPQQVNDRTLEALRSNDLGTLYDELSPSMKEMIPLEEFLLAQSSGAGSITVVLLEVPQIKSESPWNGEWADAKIRVTRNGSVEDYLVRYHLENGGWWLYATLKLN